MYASVSELKDRLGFTDPDRDFALDRAIESASRWIDKTLGTRFYTTAGTPEVRYYSVTNCGWEIAVDDVLSVSEVATDANNDGTYETIWTANTDYRLGPANAALKGEPYRKLEKVWYSGRFFFPAFDRAIRVTSDSFGYCTLANVPPSIRELTMMVAQKMAPEILDATLPGTQTYKLGNEITVTMASQELPPLAQTILRQFRPTGGYIF